MCLISCLKDLKYRTETQERASSISIIMNSVYDVSHWQLKHGHNVEQNSTKSWFHQGENVEFLDIEFNNSCAYN